MESGTMLDAKGWAMRPIGPASAARRRALGLMPAFVLMSSCGCAGFRPSESGFLQDYSGLRRDPVHLNYGLGLERANSRNASAEQVAAIDSYHIEPVRWLVPESSRAGRDPSREGVLSAELEQALRKELGGLKPIVDQPGPHTARIRSAITVVELARPIANTALLATAVTPLFIGPVFGGSGVIEVEAIGPDGSQIAAVSCASAGGPLDLVGYYSRSGHAKKAMKRASHEMKETLEAR